MTCRFCKNLLHHQFIDLINSPASNSFLVKEQLNEPEIFYPLKVYVCEHCFLVQIDEYKKSDAIFNSSYVYFSSYSTSWLKHAESYVEKMISRFKIDSKSLVIEIASNDGYLLQYFNQRAVPVLGIEPTANTAKVAIEKGIPTQVEFFGVTSALQLRNDNKQADLLLGNNVLAHVPDIVDFVRGMKIVLKKEGVVTMEFPHVMQLIEKNQFDTIYHEHFSYLSFHTVKKIFESEGLSLFDVEELSTHGGSLRIYAKHADDISKKVSESVSELLDKENSIGITQLGYYSSIQPKALKVKSDLLSFLIEQKRNKKSVVAYGAAAKGNTLLNYCGIKNDLISFVVDANPNKQNKFLPASHIPVLSEDKLKEFKPDYVLILPWNIQEEVIDQLSYIGTWNGRFVVPIPEVKVI